MVGHLMDMVVIHPYNKMSRFQDYLLEFKQRFASRPGTLLVFEVKLESLVKQSTAKVPTVHGEWTAVLIMPDESEVECEGMTGEDALEGLLMKIRG